MGSRLSRVGRRIGLEAHEYFFQKSIQNSVDAVAHLNRGFRVPVMKVVEGTGDIISDVPKAMVDTDISLPLFLFFRGCLLASGASWLETSKVAAATIHGCSERREYDRATCSRLPVLSRGLGRIGVLLRGFSDRGWLSRFVSPELLFQPGWI